MLKTEKYNANGDWTDIFSNPRLQIRRKSDCSTLAGGPIIQKPLLILNIGSCVIQPGESLDPNSEQSKPLSTLQQAKSLPWNLNAKEVIIELTTDRTQRT